MSLKIRYPKAWLKFEHYYIRGTLPTTIKGEIKYNSSNGVIIPITYGIFLDFFDICHLYISMTRYVCPEYGIAYFEYSIADADKELIDGEASCRSYAQIKVIDEAFRLLENKLNY